MCFSSSHYLTLRKGLVALVLSMKVSRKSDSGGPSPAVVAVVIVLSLSAFVFACVVLAQAAGSPSISRAEVLALIEEAGCLTTSAANTLLTDYLPNGEYFNTNITWGKDGFGSHGQTTEMQWMVQGEVIVMEFFLLGPVVSDGGPGSECAFGTIEDTDFPLPQTDITMSIFTVREDDWTYFVSEAALLNDGTLLICWGIELQLGDIVGMTYTAAFTYTKQTLSPAQTEWFAV